MTLVARTSEVPGWSSARESATPARRVYVKIEQRKLKKARRSSVTRYRVFSV
jgi:hypothetical protein